MMKRNHPWLLFWTLLLPWPLMQCSTMDNDWREDEKAINAIQPPAEVMKTIGVEEGMVIGEFGAGYGRYTLFLAARVGENGSVYANDIEESSLSFLSQRCKEAGLKNVKTILGKTDDPLFPKGSLDMAFSTRVYHELENPVAFMRNLLPALKPKASVVLIDFDPQKDRDMLKKRRVLKTEVEEAGFEIVKMEKLNEYDVLVILRVKTQSGLK